MPENQLSQPLTSTDMIGIVNEAMHLNGLKTLPTEKENPKPGTDLQITEVQYENGEVLISIHSPHANINPYAVKIEQQDNGFIVRHAREVPHANGDEPLRVTARLPIGKKVSIGVQSEKYPDYYALADFTRPEQKVDETKPGKEGVKITFGMNTTGYGFDPGRDSEDNLGPEWWTRIEALAKVKAMDFVRIHMTWQHWNPKVDVYEEVDLLRVVKRLKKMGLKIAYCVRPYRTVGDPMIPAHEVAVDHTGREFAEGPEGLNNHYVTFAPGGVVAQQAFTKSIEALGKFMHEHAPDSVYAALGWGYTEEYTLPVNYNKLGTGGQTPSGMCIYSQADRQLFKTMYGFELPVYEADWFPDSLDRLYKKHPQVLDYITHCMSTIQHDFNNAIRKHSQVPVCGYYADVPTKQSAWYGHRDMIAIFGDCDMIYSTDGEENHKDKLRAADFHRGTFPNLTSIIELDPTDTEAGKEYDAGQVNVPKCIETLTSAVQRGVRIVSWAMAFGPNQASALGQIAQEIRKGVEVDEKPAQGVTSVFGPDFYSDAALYHAEWDAAEGWKQPTPIHAVRYDV